MDNNWLALSAEYQRKEDEFNKDDQPGVSILDIGTVIAEAIPENASPKLKKIKDSIEDILPKTAVFVVEQRSRIRKSHMMI